MDKHREAVCGCCGRALPPKPIDQSLIETKDWPCLTPEMLREAAEGESRRTGHHATPQRPQQ